jgi:ubiquinone/menaquinone biosynthesis C-methylase UbiE
MGIIAALADRPLSFHLLRKIPELNFGQTKKKIHEYFVCNRLTLDLGCGTAEFCRCFAPGVYLGIDISEKYISFAKRRNPEYSFAIAAGQNLCLRAKTFPQILINGVIHHLNDEQAKYMLSETRRILTDDGKLLLIEDIETTSTSPFSRVIHSMDKGDNIRWREQYEQLLNKFFEIEAASTYYSGFCHYGLWLLRKSNFVEPSIAGPGS